MGTAVDLEEHCSPGPFTCVCLPIPTRAVGKFGMERKKVWKSPECIVFTSDRCGVHMHESARKHEREEGSVGLGRRAS